jgi:acyl carrier protein
MSRGNLLLLLLVAAFLVVGLLHLLIKRRAARVVAGREPDSHADFGRRFFAGDEVAIAANARALLNRYIPVDASLVGPDDELVQDLCLAAIDGLDADEYVSDLERSFGIRIPSREAARWRTLRDIVFGVSECLKSEQSNNTLETDV